MPNINIDLKAELTPLRLNPGDTLWVKLDTDYLRDDGGEKLDSIDARLKEVILEALPKGVKVVIVDGLTPIAVTSDDQLADGRWRNGGGND